MEKIINETGDCIMYPDDITQEEVCESLKTPCGEDNCSRCNKDD